MKTYYLIRARLKPQQSVAALEPILFAGRCITPHAGKALVWSLFADSGDRERDFLWRWDGAAARKVKGEFLILAPRLPKDNHALFDLEWKEFTPVLSAGDRLAFRLRANAVVRKALPGRKGSVKHDIVMNALPIDKAQRKNVRWKAVEEAGSKWIERQMSAAGAELNKEGLGIDGYEQHTLPSSIGKPIEFSTLDFDGTIIVQDPPRFVAALYKGFGASKAYGCGLLLIRRA